MSPADGPGDGHGGPGSGFTPQRALCVTPHGDDVTLFAGGTLAGWVDAGCRVCVVRVTQDEKDAFEHEVEETIRRNREEFGRAMEVLGIDGLVHLGYRDCELCDVPYGELRERLIRQIRSFRPQVVVSFDPAVTDDENPDHRVVATATADAAWAAAYPNFHPEHAGEGLATHRVLGCYYFTRQMIQGETAVDIGASLTRKIRAVACQETMMRTLLADQKTRVADAGIRIPFLESVSLDEHAAYWGGLLQAAAAVAAGGTGYRFAERFRSTLLGEEDPLVQLLLSL